MNEESLHKYLFTAELKNGSTFVQPADDHSELDPEKRTAFYDLLEISKDNPVVRFSISDGEKSLLVDLTDGHFEVNGVSVYPQHEGFPGSPKFRLIYHRTVREHFGMDMNLKSKEIVGYFVGWQVTIKKIVNGKVEERNIQSILGMS